MNNKILNISCVMLMVITVFMSCSPYYCVRGADTDASLITYINGTAIHQPIIISPMSVVPPGSGTLIENGIIFTYTDCVNNIGLLIQNVRPIGTLYNVIGNAYQTGYQLAFDNNPIINFGWYGAPCGVQQWSDGYGWHRSNNWVSTLYGGSRQVTMTQIIEFCITPAGLVHFGSYVKFHYGNPALSVQLYTVWWKIEQYQTFSTYVYINYAQTTTPSYGSVPNSWYSEEFDSLTCFNSQCSSVGGTDQWTSSYYSTSTTQHYWGAFATINDYYNFGSSQNLGGTLLRTVKAADLLNQVSPQNNIPYIVWTEWSITSC